MADLVASTFTGQQGEYFPRIVQVRNALNTLVNVMVEGQAGRYDWVKLVGPAAVEDVPIRQALVRRDVRRRSTSPTRASSCGVVTTNGPNYMKPLATGGIDAASANPIPAPRIFRLSARYRF